MDQEQEQQHLKQANADIADAYDRVRHHRALIARMSARGQDTALAEALLATLRNTLAAMENHRRIILDRLQS
jgi:hypothetical protein